MPATTSAPWRRADAQVLVEDLAEPVLDRDAAHHLGRVLRLRDGATVCATDGGGGWVACRFDGADAVEPLGPVSREIRPSPELAVGFALGGVTAACLAAVPASRTKLRAISNS